MGQQFLGTRRGLDDRANVATQLRGRHLQESDGCEHRCAAIAVQPFNQAGRMRGRTARPVQVAQVEGSERGPQTDPGVRPGLVLGQSAQQTAQRLAVRPEDVREQ